MNYGHARVSTDGQSVDAQVKEPRAAGTEKFFRETASAARADCAKLRRALDQLDKDGVLMVTYLDRLARSTRDLLNTLAAITRKGAGFRSLHVHADKNVHSKRPTANRCNCAGLTDASAICAGALSR